MKPRIRVSPSVFWANAGRRVWSCSDGIYGGIGETPAQAYQNWEFNRIFQSWKPTTQSYIRKPMPYAPYIQMGE